MIGASQTGSLTGVQNPVTNVAVRVNNTNNKTIEKIAESVTTTAILEQILGIAIVAFVLTILELVSILYIVFPGIKEKIIKMISSQAIDTQLTLSIKPLIETLASRESEFTKKANQYIEIVAWCFAGMLFISCIILVFFINNEYRLRGQTTPPGAFLSIGIWSFITIVCIASFQGLGCIGIGIDSMLCSKNSFAVVSSEWKQNENFAQIALSTGICDNVADAKSFSSNLSTPLQTQLATHIAQQLAADDIGQEQLTSQIQQSLVDAESINERFSEESQKRAKATGVMER